MVVIYGLVAILAVCALAHVRNAQVYRIRMAILHDEDCTVGECNDNHDKLPSYNYMFGHPTQWTMWTVAQYKDTYLGK